MNMAGVLNQDLAHVTPLPAMQGGQGRSGLLSCPDRRGGTTKKERPCFRKASEEVPLVKNFRRLFSELTGRDADTGALIIARDGACAVRPRRDVSEIVFVSRE